MTDQPPGNVTLVELDESSFREYRETLIRDYANDKVLARTWSAEEARERAANDIDGLLPAGPATPGHDIYAVVDQSIGAEVGKLWISPRDSGLGCAVWIYDIVVHERFRRRGYAGRMLALVEDRARDLGASSVDLHVFAHNYAARALYEKSGYQETDLTMSKSLLAEDG